MPNIICGHRDSSDRAIHIPVPKMRTGNDDFYLAENGSTEALRNIQVWWQRRKVLHRYDHNKDYSTKVFTEEGFAVPGSFNVDRNNSMLNSLKNAKNLGLKLLIKNFTSEQDFPRGNITTEQVNGYTKFFQNWMINSPKFIRNFEFLTSEERSAGTYTDARNGFMNLLNKCRFQKDADNMELLFKQNPKLAISFTKEMLCKSIKNASNASAYAPNDNVSVDYLLDLIRNKPNTVTNLVNWLNQGDSRPEAAYLDAFKNYQGSFLPNRIENAMRAYQECVTEERDRAVAQAEGDVWKGGFAL